MAIGLRLSAYVSLASLCGFASGCGPAEAGPPFLGQFAFEGGSVHANCQGAGSTQELAGIQVDIVRDGGGLAFIAGPRCRVGLNVDDGAAHATAGQRCQLSVSQTIASAVFTSFSLRAGDPGIHCDASGTADLIVPNSVHIACEGFTLSGVLLRRSDDP